MIAPGTAFRCLLPPGHLFIVLTPPDEDGMALIVNLSTLRDNEEDCSCILTPEDYPCFIRHNTVVMYRCARLGSVLKLLDTRHFQRMDDLPAITLAKIIKGALRSDFLRERYKHLIRITLGES